MPPPSRPAPLSELRRGLAEALCAKVDQATVARGRFSEGGRTGGRLLGDLAHGRQRAISGEGRFDPRSRAAYATGASNYRQAPGGLALPRHTAAGPAAPRPAPP